MAARGDQNALIWVSTEVDKEIVYSYRELQREVERMAAILLEQGVQPGDRVLIYMPMIPEAAFAMLACARIGAVHSVVFGGFASVSLASRIEDAEPVMIVSTEMVVFEWLQACTHPRFKPVLGLVKTKIE